MGLPWVTTTETEPVPDVVMCFWICRVLLENLGPDLGIAAKDSYAHTGWNAEWNLFKTIETHDFSKSKSTLFSVRLPLLPFPTILKLRISTRALQDGRRWQSRSHRVYGGA